MAPMRSHISCINRLVLSPQSESCARLRAQPASPNPDAGWHIKARVRVCHSTAHVRRSRRVRRRFAWEVRLLQYGQKEATPLGRGSSFFSRRLQTTDSDCAILREWNPCRATMNRRRRERWTPSRPSGHGRNATSDSLGRIRAGCRPIGASRPIGVAVLAYKCTKTYILCQCFPRSELCLTAGKDHEEGGHCIYSTTNTTSAFIPWRRLSSVASNSAIRV